jgi:tetratricopeptide (TPR) repeat protein
MRSDSRIIGIPVAYGLELFKDREQELEAISRHLSDPAIRVVSIIGRSGIGKSALAARVMERLTEVEWTTRFGLPQPDGLLNLSTRTAGVTLEQIFFGCARLLGLEGEARLLEIWAEARSLEDKVAALLHALEQGSFVILIDNLEDLLTNEGVLKNDELRIFFDFVFRASRPPRILVTARIPVRFPVEVRRFEARVRLTAGLPPAEGVQLLRELDRDGEAALAELSDDELLTAVVRVHGVPRALELVVGAMTRDYLTLPTLDEVLRDYVLRGDMVANLAQDHYRRLDSDARVVLGTLAVFRCPVQRTAVEWVVAPISPDLDVAAVLAQLARIHMVSVDHARRRFMLHPMDADFAYAELPTEGARSRKSLEIRVADWYARHRLPRESWRTADDVTSQRREFDHRVRAADFETAARVLDEIDEFLTWQGSVLDVISMHLGVADRLHVPDLRLGHLLGFGLARLTGGPIHEAAVLFEQARDLAERTGDRTRLREALFGLGDTLRQMGRLDDAAGPLARAAEIARELGDRDHEAHAVLSLSLTHAYRGDGSTALRAAEYLRALAEESGDVMTYARYWNARSTALLASQQWEEVIDTARKALHAYRAAGIPESNGYARNAQGIAHLALGNTANALRAFEEGRQEGAEVQTPRVEGVCLYNAAWAHWTAGDIVAAGETARRAAETLHRAGSAEAHAAEAIAEAAQLLAMGKSRSAADALSKAADRSIGNVEICPPTWLAEAAARLVGTPPDHRESAGA